MIKTEDNFLELFNSIVDNFKWQISGNHLFSFKKDLMYDPMTAYVKITTGEYVPRHKFGEVSKFIAIEEMVLAKIEKSLYSVDSSCASLRLKIFKIAGFPAWGSL